MKKHRLLIKVTIIIVIIIGCVAGLIALNENLSSTFQRPDNQYWKALVIGIPSILAGILIGYFLSKYFLRIWFKTEKSLIYKSLTILFITYIAGIITLMVALELTWIAPKLLGFIGWEYTGGHNPWSNLLDHYLLMFIYGSMPVGITSVLNGLFSFIYLKFAK